MHISEGVLSGPVLISGGALAAAGTAVGLKKLDYDRIARAGILSAAFFVASLIHVPIGPSNAHLILNGLVGLLLGWAAFPAILIGLVLQSVLFHYGGLTALGVNTMIMALPAVVCHYLFGPLVRGNHNSRASIGAFLTGFTAILGSSILAGGALHFSGEAFWGAAVAIVTAHVPVMVIEGFITLVCVGFLKKVKPEVLSVAYSN